MTSKVINQLKTSPNGRAFLKKEEGLRLKLYIDIAGHQTIGWGHKLARHEIGKLKVITQAQAETLFDSDLFLPEMFINATVHVALNQNQFDALVSFIFNIGVGEFDRSTLLKLLQAGNYQEASKQILRWNKYFDKKTNTYKVSEGLDARRLREHLLFDKAVEDDRN
ncbi:MAG TPA: muraminidase [Methylophilaceae bacterium]|nr:muraminidase [Methylophilaceae bacterium]